MASPPASAPSRWGQLTLTEPNVNTWWSCLAGAVGPGSVSEQVYSRVSSMRATDFPDAVNRLALEDPDVADHLDGS